jgi:hypothetical protein
MCCEYIEIHRPLMAMHKLVLPMDLHLTAMLLLLKLKYCIPCTQVKMIKPLICELGIVAVHKIDVLVSLEHYWCEINLVKTSSSISSSVVQSAAFMGNGGVYLV